jgi:hypothetical protein
VSANTSFTVSAAELVSLAITPANSSKALGLSQQFTATGTYTNGTTQDLTTTVTWSSSSTATATISNAAGTKGLATTVATGSTTITATHSGSGLSASTSFTVSAAELVSLAITPANSSKALGLTQQFTATGTYTDGSTHNLTNTVAWSSSSVVASIASNGLATATSIGSTTITCSLSGLMATATFIVTKAELSLLSVTPVAPTLNVAVTQQLTATGTFTDGSTQNLTTAVVWSSSSTSVASISNTSGSQGLATATGIGSTIVTASHPTSGLIASTGITVCGLNYPYRKAIVISNTNVDSNLSDFPLLVAFTNDPNLGSRMTDTTNFNDIRFTDSDGATLLKYEKESMSISGGLATGRYWVRVPLIKSSSNTTLYVYYGKSGAADGSDKNNVWDANYNSVWHFSEGTGTITRDSKNNMTGTLMGGANAPTWTSSGAISNGLSFNGSGYIAISGGVPPSGNTQYTLEAWIKIANTGNRRGIVGWGTYGATSQCNALRSTNEFTGRSLMNYWWASLAATSTDPLLTANIWSHAVSNYSQSQNTVQLFFNGMLNTTYPLGTTAPNFTTNNYEIGRTAFVEYWQGTLDEVRISNIARSSAWIKFEHLNMSLAGNGLSFGAEEQTGCN